MASMNFLSSFFAFSPANSPMSSGKIPSSLRLLKAGMNYIKNFASDGFLKLEINISIEEVSGIFKIYWHDNLPIPRDKALEYFQLFLTNGTLNSTASIVYHIRMADIQSKNIDIGNIALYRYDTSAKDWVKIEYSLDTESNTIVFQLDSFSYFVIAEKELPLDLSIFIILGIILGIVIFVLVVMRTRPKVQKSYQKKLEKKEKITWTPIEVKKARKKQEATIKKYQELMPIEKFSVEIPIYKGERLKESLLTDIKRVKETINLNSVEFNSKKISEEEYLRKKHQLSNNEKELYAKYDVVNQQIQEEAHVDLLESKSNLAYLWVYDLKKSEIIYNFASGILTLDMNETNALIHSFKHEELIAGEIFRFGLQLSDLILYIIEIEGSEFSKIIAAFVQNPGKMLNFTMKQFSNSLEGFEKQIRANPDIIREKIDSILFQNI